MIELRDVVKTFPERYGIINWLRRGGRTARRPAIRGVSFSVERGELFGLLGANGSGKSTILRMLAGLVTPDSGGITLAGVDVVAHPVRARTHLGLSTGDERSFFYRLSARQNMELYAGLYGIPHARRAATIESCVRVVDLQDDLDRRFDSYSSGMRQRLGIARALLADPDVLLLDEPTRAVDPVHAEQLRATVVKLVREHGMTVIIATNLLEEAWSVCDRIAVLSVGRVLAVGRGADLRARAAGLRRYALTLDRLDDAFVARLRAVAGVTAVEPEGNAGAPRLRVTLDPQVRSLNDLLAAASHNGVAVTEIGPEPLSGADLFANLTAEASDAG